MFGSHGPSSCGVGLDMHSDVIDLGTGHAGHAQEPAEFHTVDLPMPRDEPITAMRCTTPQILPYPRTTRLHDRRLPVGGAQ